MPKKSFCRKRKRTSLGVRGRPRKYGRYGRPTPLGTGARRRTRTRTVTRRKNKRNLTAVSGGVGSFSSFNYGSRMAPKAYIRVLKATTPNYNYKNNSGRMTTTTGVQAIYETQTLFNNTDIAGLRALITSSSNLNTRMYLENVRAETIFTNQSQENCFMTIYDIISRKDMASATYATPHDAWYQGLANTAAGQEVNQFHVGSTPFVSNSFTQNYKVLKVQKVIMAAGSVHRHNVRFSPRKMFNNVLLSNGTLNVKGLTCFTMCIVHGQPSNDVTTKTQVSTGAVAVDYVSKKYYKYRWTADYDTTHNFTNTLPAAYTVNEDIMDYAFGDAKVNPTLA